MAETHEYLDVNGRCGATEADGRECRRGRAADVHKVDRTESTIRRAVPLGDRRPEVRSLPDARGRRAVPWNELPALSKVIFGVGTFLALVLLACVVATLCRLILSAGGWFG